MSAPALKLDQYSQESLVNGADRPDMGTAGAYQQDRTSYLLMTKKVKKLKIAI
jgi:hypothetical protein